MISRLIPLLISNFVNVLWTSFLPLLQKTNCVKDVCQLYESHLWQLLNYENTTRNLFKFECLELSKGH